MTESPQDAIKALRDALDSYECMSFPAYFASFNPERIEIVLEYVQALEASISDAVTLGNENWSLRERVAALEAEVAKLTRIVEGKQERIDALRAHANELQDTAEAMGAVIVRAARIMHGGEGVADQGEAYDRVLSLLDAARGGQG